MTYKRWTRDELTQIIEAYQEVEHAAEQVVYEQCGKRIKSITIRNIDINDHEGCIEYTRKCSSGARFGEPGWGSPYDQEHDEYISIDGLIKTN